MQFEWHDEKNVSNWQKHGIRFEYAAYVFLDECRIDYIDNRKDYGEIRHTTIGRIEGVHYTVVYTLRKGIYRLISARRANQDEIKTYQIYAQK